MLGDKKKSSNRLSGLFSKSTSDTQDAASTKTKSTTASDSTGRLTKVRNRISSATHLAPDYPTPTSPSAPRHVSLQNPTIQPVETEFSAAFAPLEPPPPLAVPGSRNASPSGRGSRPGTPGGESSAGDGNLKKLRRKSKLFGGSQADLVGAVDAPPPQEKPLAWIVGHKGKVPYNLAMLLNGEKVGQSVARSGLSEYTDIDEGYRTLGRAGRHSSLPLSANVQQGSLLPHRLLRIFSIATADAPCSWQPILGCKRYRNTTRVRPFLAACLTRGVRAVAHGFAGPKPGGQLRGLEGLEGFE